MSSVETEDLNDYNSNLHLTKNSVWITITEVNTVLKPTLSELKQKKLTSLIKGK